MNLQRLVLLSSPNPDSAPHDVLSVCYGFPHRNKQSGIGGKIICFGDQFALLLEGAPAALAGLVERIGREAPEAGMSVRVSQPAEERIFTGWAIRDIYLDELCQLDLPAAERLGDLLIDLFGGASSDTTDPFAEIVLLTDGLTPTSTRLPVRANAA